MKEKEIEDRSGWTDSLEGIRHSKLYTSVAKIERFKLHAKV